LGNREQNRQFRAAVREIERILGRELRDTEWERLHREVSKQDYSFKVIIEIGVGMFG
jgi:hypothetical protein